MASIVDLLDRWFYPDTISNWDDKLFRRAILQVVNSDATILDLGAGAGIVSQMNFKGIVRRVCGVDLDPRVEANPLLDEGRVADAGRIPFGDEMFDVVFSDNVVEHLDDPASVFLEVRRVLRPGGVFIFKTPNRRHYMPTIARMTPHSFHQWVNRMRGRAEVDTFPTRYRANTSGEVSRLANETGFHVDQLRLIEGRPEYLRVSWPTYVIGIFYERLVNRLDFLKPFRILLIARLIKQAG